MRRFLSLTPALFLALACGGGESASTDTDEVNGHADEVTREGSENAEPSEIAGTYAVTGTNEDGSAYEGSLVVRPRGSVYQFSWATGNDYEGVGVVDGSTVAVGWGAPECGVALYEVQDDGALMGAWAMYNNEASGTESARRTSGDGLVGAYTVDGTNPDGTRYAGNLDITPNGESYRLQWEAGGTSLGQGIVMDDMIGSSYGTDACGVAVYRIRGGNLEGQWTTYGSPFVGTENAVKG